MTTADPTRSSWASRHEVKLIVLFCFLQLSIYLKDHVYTSFDSGWTVPLAYSILEEGNTDLDEFEAIVPTDDYRVITVDGHLRSYYPVGPALVVLPPVAILKYLGRKAYGIRLEKQHNTVSHSRIERLLGSLVVIASTLLLYRLARRRLGIGMAMLLAAAFAFSTSAWSVLSRGMWQHSPLVLCLFAALLFLLRERAAARAPKQFFGGALMVAIGYWMRPTGIEPIVVLSAWVALYERKNLVPWAAGLAAGLIPFLLHNYLTLGSLLPSYYVPGQNPGFSFADFGEGLAGTLVSPGRGLFLYCPLVLLAFVGAWLAWKEKAGSIYLALAALPVLHWLLLASRENWWGGFSYGPRLFSDMFPVFFVFLIPVMKEIAGQGLLARKWARPTLGAAFAILFAAGVWINEKGTDWPAWDWNGYPESVDHAPQRNWDWNDTAWSRKTEHFEHLK
jgi:hypothetical protein